MSVDVFEIIKSRQRKNKDLWEARIRKVEALEPSYTNLINKRNELLSEAAILHLSKQEGEAEKKEREAQKLDAKEQQILKKLGLPADYLEEIYDCPVCHDKGYLDNHEPCNCIKKIIRQDKYKSFDLTESFKNCTFENFDLSLFSERISEKYNISPRKATLHYLQRAEEFCRNFKDQKSSFFIYGNVGVGKTFYVSCIVNELIKKDIDIIYISAPNLLNYLYEDISSHSNVENSYKNEFKNIELLVIDDLGSENMNDFSLSALSEIIDYRILNKKSTIITSNYTPNFMMTNHIYPERMANRIVYFYEAMPFIGRNLRVKRDN